MQYQLADLFESIVDRVPGREALVAEGRRLTYAELDARANRLAHHLRNAGIGNGDHVGCYLQNGSEYVEALLACFKISAVPVNVNYRYVADELLYLFDDADLVGLVFDAEFADRVALVAPRVATLRHLLVVGGEAEGATPYEDALAAQPDDRPDASTRSPDDIWLLYTGGTTGMPKGVMWRHEDIFFAGMGGGNPVMDPVTSPEELAGKLDPTPGVWQHTMFPSPPLMHGAAQLGTFIGFWGGARVVLIRRYTGHGALQLIEQEKVNTINLVGDAMAIPLIEARAERDYDTSSLFVLSTAGAIMSKTIRDRVKELFPTTATLDSFGSSETGYGGSEVEGSSPDTGLKFRMTARTAVIGDDLTIVQPGEDRSGRVSQRGHIPLGYYGDEAKTAEAFVTIDGERWVLTGDSATVDTDGVIHVLGRGSVCINSGGEKVFPEEVEAALKSHPAVLDAIVAGVPDERWGERVAAVVQLRAGAEEPADLEEHLAARIARYKIPRTVVYVDQVQRSPSGKPDYRWARTTAAAG